MCNLKSVNILELTEGCRCVEQFREGDKIKFNWREKEYIGVINYIDTDRLTVDVSKECQSNIIYPYFKNIKDIVKIDKKIKD